MKYIKLVMTTQSRLICEILVSFLAQSIVIELTIVAEL